MPRNTSKLIEDANPDDTVDPVEEAYKRAGLEVSNAELAAKPKGFIGSLSRFTEGNIDQPGSEAYNKYGAGRGRALEAAKAKSQTRPAAVTPSQMPTYSGRVADRRADIQSENAPSETALMKRQASSMPSMGEDKRSDMDDFQGAPARTKQVSATPPMVTKEELAASGMSLRDYLNAKQGLTRRGGTTSPKSMPGSSSAPSQALMPNRGGQPGGSLPSQRPRGQGTVIEQGRNVDLYGDTINDLSSVLKRNPKNKSFFEANDERIANLKKGGSVKKMSTGGSASRRGDGIAQRGKTKGRLC